MSVQTHLDRIKTAKESLVTAITNKGVEVPEDALIDELPALVDEIVGSPLDNMNECIVCNGEKITLTVGEEVQSGQVLTFLYSIADGYSVKKYATDLDVQTENVQGTLQGSGYAEKTLTISDDFAYYVLEGCYFVFSEVTDPKLQDKTITENGSYTADVGYDGLGTVTVNVAGGGSDGSGGGSVIAGVVVSNSFNVTTYDNSTVLALGNALAECVFSTELVE